MSKRLAIYLYLVFFIACTLSCRSLQFYGEPDKPFYYSGEKNKPAAEQIDSLNVLTFNIKKARKIQLAITELQQLEKTNGIDIYLLQEMDEKGVEAIAAALNVNYLYIPIAYDKSDKKDIGNAILTKGTIANPQKLILPHAKWQNQQRRDVTIGQVTIHQKKILVYSVHNETVGMGPKDRSDQVDSIINLAKTQASKYEYVLVGGDFNTLFPKDARTVAEKFNSKGFDSPAEEIGYTSVGMLGLVKPRLDHLFTKGLKAVRAYKITTSKSSDHFPVFATFRFN